MKSWLFGLVFYLLLVGDSNTCLLFRTRGFVHSYLPAVIQILHHYKAQLRKYYPYKFSDYCRHKDKKLSNGVSFNPDNLFEPSTDIHIISREADICVLETDTKIRKLLIDLQRKALWKNFNEFQGFKDSVLFDLEKSSKMASHLQLLHVLKKLLLEEDILTNSLRCKINDMLTDLQKSQSKLFRNLLLVQPLRYTNWKRTF